MNSDLDDLTNWFKANRLALHVNKSNCMLFQPNGNQNTVENTLNIGVDPIELDDLYKFKLSKFMFDCINGILPTPILEYFITNATIHAHHTRQRNVPHVTPTFSTISERAVAHKGPKTWTEIPQTIRSHQNKNIFSRLLKNDYITKYN